MAATLYVKLEDALALLDEFKGSLPDSDTRVKVSELALRLCTRVDLGAMSLKQHGEFMEAAFSAAFGPKKA